MATSPAFGKDLVVKFSTIGSSTCAYDPAVEMKDISRHVMSIDGLPGEREMSDVTCGGSPSAHEWLNGLLSGSVTLVALLDQTSADCVSAWKTFAGYSTDDTDSRYFFYAPASTVAGNPLIHGRVTIDGIVLPAKPLEPLTFTVNMSLSSTLIVGICG